MHLMSLQSTHIRPSSFALSSLIFLHHLPSERIAFLFNFFIIFLAFLLEFVSQFKDCDFYPSFSIMLKNFWVRFTLTVFGEIVGRIWLYRIARL